MEQHPRANGGGIAADSSHEWEQKGNSGILVAAQKHYLTTLLPMRAKVDLAFYFSGMDGAGKLSRLDSILCSHSFPSRCPCSPSSFSPFLAASPFPFPPAELRVCQPLARASLLSLPSPAGSRSNSEDSPLSFSLKCRNSQPSNCTSTPCCSRWISCCQEPLRSHLRALDICILPFLTLQQFLRLVQTTLAALTVRPSTAIPALLAFEYDASERRQ